MSTPFRPGEGLATIIQELEAGTQKPIGDAALEDIELAAGALETAFAPQQPIAEDATRQKLTKLLSLATLPEQLLASILALPDAIRGSVESNKQEEAIAATMAVARLALGAAGIPKPDLKLKHGALEEPNLPALTMADLKRQFNALSQEQKGEYQSWEQVAERMNPEALAMVNTLENPRLIGIDRQGNLVALDGKKRVPKKTRGLSYNENRTAARQWQYLRPDGQVLTTANPADAVGAQILADRRLVKLYEVLTAIKAWGAEEAESTYTESGKNPKNIEVARSTLQANRKTHSTEEPIHWDDYLKDPNKQNPNIGARRAVVVYLAKTE